MKNTKTKLVEEADKLQEVYLSDTKKIYDNKPVQSRIAMFGNILCNLSQEQARLSNELGIICLTVTKEDNVEKERNRISQLSSELAKNYLKSIVLTRWLQLDFEHSLSRLIGASANNNIELDLSEPKSNQDKN